MKFLTICFLVFYIFTLINKKSLINLINKMSNMDSIEINKILLGDNYTDRANLFKFCIYGGLSIIVCVIEVFYMFFALSYLPKIIGIGYIIFWFYILIVQIIKKKKGNNKILKLSLMGYMQSVIDILYYLCMVKVLFL